MKSFVSLLETYDIVPAPERELFEKQASSIRDPAKKRELKINQFKKEKELKNRIQVGTPSLLMPRGFLSPVTYRLSETEEVNNLLRMTSPPTLI